MTTLLELTDEYIEDFHALQRQRAAFDRQRFMALGHALIAVLAGAKIARSS